MEDYTSAREVFTAQREALARTLDRLEPSFAAAVALLAGTQGKVVTTGLGKSGIVAHKLAATFASTGTSSVYINAGEALHGDLGVVQPGDAVVMISASAATPELVKMLPSLQRFEVRVLGLFGRTDTPLAHACDVVLNVGVEVEACPLQLAPMSSVTCALVTGDALAAALMRRRGFQPEDFALRHPGGSLGRRLLLRARDVMHRGEALPRVGPDATMSLVVAELTRPNLGAVCVVGEAGRLQGIITDGDVRRALLQPDPMALTAEALMTAQPRVGDAESRLGDLLDLMESHRIYVLPIVNDRGGLEGLVRMHDLLGGA